MNVLVVMRLADMHRRHPDQDDTRFCPSCGERVGIYPSGQAALRFDPSLAIQCQICAQKEPARIQILAPGALEERFQSYAHPINPKDVQ